VLFQSPSAIIGARSKELDLHWSRTAFAIDGRGGGFTCAIDCGGPITAAEPKETHSRVITNDHSITTRLSCGARIYLPHRIASGIYPTPHIIRILTRAYKSELTVFLNSAMENLGLPVSCDQIRPVMHSRRMCAYGKRSGCGGALEPTTNFN
jgi:hypothetical protein